MQLLAGQTSLEPHPHRGEQGRAAEPIVSQNARRRRQPIRERARPAQRPRIPDPQAPSDELNKLPILCCYQPCQLSRWRHADCLVLGAACQQLDRPDGLMALRDGRGVERGAVDQVDATVDVSKAGVEQSGLFHCGSGERVVAGPGPCRGEVAVCCLPEIGAGAAG